MYVTGTGMVCSVGLNAATACAAMRAGISNFVELPYYDDQGTPIVGAMVPSLEGSMGYYDRLVNLLVSALVDCLKETTQQSFERVPLLIGLAELERPGENASFSRSIIRQVQQKLGLLFHPTFSQSISQGHTSGFKALCIARDMFRLHGVPACLVCGVDSFLTPRLLYWLNRYWRLKTEENSDGVIPGEAAAAVLLQHDVTIQDHTATRVSGLGFAHESASIMTEDPLLGIGLANAARTALADAGLQMHDIDFRFTDVTGESYGFREQALSLGRLLRQLKEEFPSWHCSDSIGDTGAAAGISQLVVAVHAFKKGYAPGKRSICHTSAVSGDRAVAVIQGGNREGH